MWSQGVRRWRLAASSLSLSCVDGFLCFRRLNFKLSQRAGDMNFAHVVYNYIRVRSQDVLDPGIADQIAEHPGPIHSISLDPSTLRSLCHRTPGLCPTLPHSAPLPLVPRVLSSRSSRFVGNRRPLRTCPRSGDGGRTEFQRRRPDEWGSERQQTGRSRNESKDLRSSDPG